MKRITQEDRNTAWLKMVTAFKFGESTDAPVRQYRLVLARDLAEGYVQGVGLGEEDQIFLRSQMQACSEFLLGQMPRMSFEETVAVNICAPDLGYHGRSCACKD
jgi:hypothetical protein